MSSRAAWLPASVGEPTTDYTATKDDDVELWMIRCPPDFDPSQLHGAAFQFDPNDSQSASSSSQSLMLHHSSADEVVLNAVPRVESQGFICAMPSAKKQRWMLAKHFARQFAISGGRSSSGGSSVATAPAHHDAPRATLPPVPMKPNLRLRGLMAIPDPDQPEAELRLSFRKLASTLTKLRQGHPEAGPLDTLSMGMSDDLEMAIAEGATWVRVGTALFGARPAKHSQS